MTYELAYAENADVIGSYESLDAARSEFDSLIESRPDLRDELVIRQIDGDGRAIGEPIMADSPQTELAL